MPENKSIPRKKLGDSGFNDYSWNNTNQSAESLLELQGREGSLNYMRMSKTDGVIGMILRVYKNPIRSANWVIPYPPQATPEEKKAVNALRSHFFGYSGRGFDGVLGRILSMLEYGFSVFEKYYEYKDFEGQKYLMPCLEQRLQFSIAEIVPDDRKIVQIMSKGKNVDISFDNLVFFVLDQQGNDYRGTSLLRNAYRAYKDKRNYREWLGNGIQRSLGGVPVMKMPRDTDLESKKYLAAENFLINITNHEQAYAIIDEDCDLQFVDSKFNASQLREAIESANSEMALSVLSQFMLLGQNGNSGAFALSRDQSDFFLDGLSYITKIISGVFNEEVIGEYIDINFGERIEKNRIRLECKNLNKKAGIELADVVSKLSQSGFLTSTVEDEIQIRDNLELPELSEDGVKARRDSSETSGLEKDREKKVNEKPVKFSEKFDRDRSAYIANKEEEVLNLMRGNLMIIKDKLVADIKNKLETGTVEIAGLKNIKASHVKLADSLKKKLSAIAIHFWDSAKKDAKSQNVKLSEEENLSKIPDKSLAKYVENISESISEKQVAAMLNVATLTASNNMLKGYSIIHSLANVSRAVDKNIAGSAILVDASLATVSTANFGESQFMKLIENKIWGYEFVAVDDGNTTQICSWYSGKKFSPSSQELSVATPPLHPNCRSYLRPIYKKSENEKKPDIDDLMPPASVLKGKTFF